MSTLINCPTCGKQVSSGAATCPHCGEPGSRKPITLQQRRVLKKCGIAAIALSLFSGVAAFACLLSGHEPIEGDSAAMAAALSRQAATSAAYSNAARFFFMAAALLLFMAAFCFHKATAKEELK